MVKCEISPPALDLEAAGDAERDGDRAPLAGRVDLADDAEARPGADARRERRGEAEAEQRAGADGELDLARAALLDERADDAAQRRFGRGGVLEFADALVGAVRELQRVADDVGEPDPGRRLGNGAGRVERAKAVEQFVEGLVEAGLEREEAGERLGDLAADAEGERILDFAQRPFVEVHLPGVVADLGELLLELEAEDAHRLADLRERLVRVLAVGAVLDGGHEGAADVPQLAEDLLERGVGVGEIRGARAGMLRHGARDGGAERRVELAEGRLAGDDGADVLHRLAGRLEHALGGVQVPVAAGRDGVVGDEPPPLAAVRLQVRAAAVLKGGVQVGIRGRGDVDGGVRPVGGVRPLRAAGPGKFARAEGRDAVQIRADADGGKRHG